MYVCFSDYKSLHICICDITSYQERDLVRVLERQFTVRWVVGSIELFLVPASAPRLM